jgi:hypothetical protein
MTTKSNGNSKCNGQRDVPTLIVKERTTKSPTAGGQAWISYWNHFIVERPGGGWPRLTAVSVSPDE